MTNLTSSIGLSDPRLGQCILPDSPLPGHLTSMIARAFAAVD